MRYLLLFTVLLTFAACKSESDNCFKKQLPIERARYTCYDLLQAVKPPSGKDQPMHARVSKKITV